MFFHQKKHITKDVLSLLDNIGLAGTSLLDNICRAGTSLLDNIGLEGMSLQDNRDEYWHVGGGSEIRY